MSASRWNQLMAARSVCLDTFTMELRIFCPQRPSAVSVAGSTGCGVQHSPSCHFNLSNTSSSPNILSQFGIPQPKKKSCGCTKNVCPNIYFHPPCSSGQCGRVAGVASVAPPPAPGHSHTKPHWDDRLSLWRSNSIQRKQRPLTLLKGIQQCC